MGSYLKKKEVKKALEEARRLEGEPEPIPTREQEVEIQKDVVSLSEQLKKLLKPSWFVKDVHQEESKSGKKAKKKKSRAPPCSSSKRPAASCKKK